GAHHPFDLQVEPGLEPRGIHQLPESPGRLGVAAQYCRDVRATDLRLKDLTRPGQGNVGLPDPQGQGAPLVATGPDAAGDSATCQGVVRGIQVDVPEKTPLDAADDETMAQGAGHQSGEQLRG